MSPRALAGVFTLCLLTAASVSAGPGAADDVTLFRLFLKDGTTLVSYGELARVGDRVVFSMPTGAVGPNVPLHLVNLGADRVDWERTNRYADAARTDRYVATRAEDDYAALTSQVAATLNQVALTPDANARLAIVERARKALADWPPAHFNYRATDVHQMLVMIDEAIADLRVAAGGERFDLSFVAYAAPPPLDPVMPPPTPKEAIEQTLAAARLAESPAERTSLLNAVVVGLEREAATLPAEWVLSTLVTARGAIETEERLDRSYRSLAQRAMLEVDRRLKVADVRGIEQVLAGIRLSDTTLGAERPEAVSALVTAVEAKLDAARRFRLARDRWAMRAPALHRYRAAIDGPVLALARLKPPLEDIKSLAGSSAANLTTIQRTAARVIRAASSVKVPEELRPAHAMLLSAAQLAESAARIRREAALSGDIARAWDASSAAAGSLMLAGRARNDIQAVIRPPQAP